MKLAVASAAISAGHQARHDPKRRKQKQKEDGENLTAEQWICCVHHGIGYWEEGVAPGASTPLICLYSLGWSWGPHPFFLSMALVVILFAWGRVVICSLEDGGKYFWEMWVANVAVFFLYSTCFFIGRVFKRIPSQIPRSAGVWVALLLETCLANTLTCVAHGLGFWLWKGGWNANTVVVKFASSSCPAVLWLMLRLVVLDRQEKFIKMNNLAVRGGKDMHRAATSVPWEDAKETARGVVRDIIEKGMDLRMTGLSRKELARLPSLLGGEVADLVRFYTVRVGSREKFHVLLSNFHQGYEYAQASGRGSDSDSALLTEWCKDWAERSRGHPWMCVRQLAGSAEPPDGSPLRSCPCSHPKDQIWWLCGAIAKVSDMSMGTEYRQYALMAAALSMNQDPLAIIMAGGRAAEGRLRKMKGGCAEVLRQVSPDVQEGRGLVFTDAKEGDSPVVTYSPSEVWQAWSTRGAFMLGEDACNSLWNKPGDGALHPEERNRLQQSNTDWWNMVEIRVDFKPLFKFVGLKGNALANVVAAARLGFWMHCIWSMCAIMVRRYFPRHLPYLAVMATLFLKVGMADQCAYHVFIAAHMGRLRPIKSICRFFKPMSDRDIRDMAWNTFTVASGAVVVLSTVVGQNNATPFEAAFWGILLVPLAPGMWYFVLGGEHGIKTDSSGIVVRYPARSTREQGGRNARCGILGRNRSINWPAVAGADEGEDTRRGSTWWRPTLSMDSPPLPSWRVTGS